MINQKYQIFNSNLFYKKMNYKTESEEKIYRFKTGKNINTKAA